MPKIKKDKDKARLKVTIWATALLTKGNQIWNVDHANKFLVEIDHSKAWKGKLMMHKTYFVIKNKGNTFKEKHDYVKVSGVKSHDFNNKMMVIGLLEEDLTYLILRFESNNNRDKVAKEFNDIISKVGEINGLSENILLDESQISPSHSIELPLMNIDDEMMEKEMSIVDPQTSISVMPLLYRDEVDQLQTPPSQIIFESVTLEQASNNYKRNIPKIPARNDHFIKNSSDMSVIMMKSDMINHSAERRFEKEFNLTKDEESMWVENTKYIDYIPTLGGNVETNDGSVYMYCAYQLTAMSYPDSD